MRACEPVEAVVTLERVVDLLYIFPGGQLRRGHVPSTAGAQVPVSETHAPRLRSPDFPNVGVVKNNTGQQGIMHHATCTRGKHIKITSETQKNTKS